MTTLPPAGALDDAPQLVDGPLVDDQAEAATVLLLPGTAGSADELDGLARHLAHRHRVVRLDLPGTGRSLAWGEALPRLDVTGTAAAIADRLDRDAVAPRVVVGHSAGGIVALEVARRLGSVRGAVLIDTNLPTDPRQVRDKQDRAAALDRLPPDELRAAFTASMRRSWGPRDIGGTAWGQVMAGVDAAPERVIRQFWLSVLRLDSVRTWRELAVPTVYLRSDRPVDADALARLTDRVRYVDLAEKAAGHWVHLVEPDLVGDLVERAVEHLLDPPTTP
ncbi:alpha/beta fold hydrolase [Tersicoccus sp. MR15.9]|uniref:alpha/beta fold hydrolase n=1 Tax=Tersicoccus mangrovi TaxID=3121635 RepID=UPI002FE52BD7